MPVAFCRAHLASLEWSVDRVAQWLDRFPNAAVDLAERICHLQYQAVSDWQKVRNFVQEYQDRIIYGTDMIDDGAQPAGELQRKITEKWQMHWKFFSEDELMSVPKVEKSFRGLNLQDEVLGKIFRENAIQWYPALEKIRG
ncbi:MAG: amidohydrolase family protein [Balneolaceae bacterium]|nr:amidohydrolase family protein [Balneolaceae bacterium]